MHHALNLRELLADEIIQRRESGYELDGVLADARRVLGPDGPAWSAELEQAYRMLEQAPVRADWVYSEPQGEQEITGALPADVLLEPPPQQELTDRLHAAWLGRCAGCRTVWSSTAPGGVPQRRRPV
jgi:hypothetical protein